MKPELLKADQGGDFKTKLIILIPFIAIVLLKFLSEHLSGTFSIIAGYISIMYCVQTLRRTNYKPPYKISSPDQAINTECVLCVSPVDTIKVAYLPCKHAFCIDCLEKWLMRFSKCPYCCQPISYDASFADLTSPSQPNIF
ncbi:hypothetical protein Ciccas_005379 [Cichlidogyrus casuarinus]|uniref:RING-type domain-containing protein n=1 Tax=Cichlidogyrus casuarinus TaxID=1844966 RepID=A0ABD2QB33_9PLAT